MNSVWFRCPQPRAQARLRLFCLPAAGGGVAPFRSWVQTAPRDIELVFVRLPGRETRSHEPPARELGPLVEQLTAALRSEARMAFAIFGHSTGATVAFEVVRELERQSELCPLGLFVAAQPPPHLPKLPAVSSLSTQRLLALLRDLGGLPVEVLGDPEMVKLTLPAIRADFWLSESHEYRPGAIVEAPIHSFAGSADGYVPAEVMERWADVTAGSFRMTMLPGGHFFPQTSGPAIMEAVRRDCAAPCAENSVDDRARV